MRNIKLLIILLLSSISSFGQSNSSPIKWGPWYEIGTTQPSKTNTTNSYLKAKAAIGTNRLINESELSVEGNIEIDGDVYVNTTGINTGLLLPNPQKIAGQILVSDDEGNATWEENRIQYQTALAAYLSSPDNSGSKDFTFSNPSNMTAQKLTNLLGVQFDNVQTDFPGYGWDLTKQQYTAPRSGKYRVTMSLYTNKNAKTTTYDKQENRLSVFKNNELCPDPGFVSVIQRSGDNASYTIGMLNLVKGDVIDFRVSINTTVTGSTKAVIYLGSGHTYVIIEAL